MPVTNIEISAMLTKLADLLEIEGDNPFRVRAYRNAARLVETLPHSVADMVSSGRDLSELPGIGEALANKMKEMVETGHLGALDKEARHIPAALSDLLEVPGLGPKRVHLIYEQFHVSTMQDLEKIAKSGRLRTLHGFGEKTEALVLKHLTAHSGVEKRHLLSTAEQLVHPILTAVAHAPGVTQYSLAGSFRRRSETVGDVDILVAAESGPAVATIFTSHEDVAEVLARGDTKSSVILRSGLQVDLRIVPENSFGAALHYFTGSKTHNIAIRTRGVKAGLKINEYGVFRGGDRIGGTTEAEVFAAVGLPWIDPELRENRGEIAAAEQGQLPRLITIGDIRGDLHSHTTATDGQDTLETMAEAAHLKGYQYLAITDHSKRLTMANGLNATRLAHQIRDIDRLNARMKGFRLLKAVEVDILEDGSLDLSDDILKELDLVVASIHSRMSLTREKQTLRLINAMDNPFVSILAHPTGRLINDRAPMDIDMEQLVAAARERRCALELNAQPARLDLTDLHCRMAREAGVLVAISTDAHNAVGLDAMPYGIGQARRGWLQAENVLNTLPLAALLKAVHRS